MGRADLIGDEDKHLVPEDRSSAQKNKYRKNAHRKKFRKR